MGVGMKEPPIATFAGVSWLTAASEHAKHVDDVILGLVGTSVAVILFLGILTSVILVRYRSGSRAKRPPLSLATWKIETAWTLGTLAIFLYFFWRGAVLYLDAARPPPGAEVIDVTGRQWMWDTRYPDGTREFNALHLRLNTPVRLVLSSEDVIHSFFVPALRLKQDLIPGKLTTMWFDPDRTGTFSLYCAQYCGSAHASMIGKVTVLAPHEFDAWQRSAGARTGALALAPEARGRELFAKFGCARCHGGLNAAGPSLAGLYGTRVRLSDGTFALADDEYLHEAILHGRKVAGFAPVMPTYSGIIRDSDAADICTYIEAMKTAATP
ncbi:MAG TPA: cytochrome c oxidase subunit II [Opitutaceae bacterium]|jgi:cytochrome c oxidase subunit 2